jgi:23S rRNA (adenine2503-C2)-methyltransferase
VNLVGASSAELSALLHDLDPRPYRVAQVYQWLARRLAGSIEEMTNLPKVLRESLASRAVVRDPEVLEVQRGGEGTAKFALAYPDGAVIEAVAMPMEGHTTLCLSSQAGCAVGCVFCVTGILGAGRNLTGGEIFGQYRVIMRHEGLVGTPVNVVFMGMGEPLLNMPASPARWNCSPRRSARAGSPSRPAASCRGWRRSRRCRAAPSSRSRSTPPPRRSASG